MNPQPPRDGIDAFAQAFGVSRARAAKLLRSLPPSERFDELDERLRAESAVADCEAAAQLDRLDITDAAESSHPQAALSAIAQERAERILFGRLGAYESWAQTEDRSARTQPARDAFEARFEREVDPDRRLAPDERAKRAQYARKAYFTRLTVKSAQARRAKGHN